MISKIPPIISRAFRLCLALEGEPARLPALVNSLQGVRDGSVEEDVAAQLAAGTLEETSSVWGYGSRRGGRSPHHPSSGQPSTSPVPQGWLAGPPYPDPWLL